MKKQLLFVLALIGLMLMGGGINLYAEEITIGRTLEFAADAKYQVVSNEKAGVTISDGTGKTGSGKTLYYKGNSIVFSGTSFRDKTPLGTNLISFNEDCYAGVKIVIADGYKISMSQIKARVAVFQNFTYRVVVSDGTNAYYTSSDKVITKYTETSATNLDATITPSSAIDLKGTVYVRLYYWYTGDNGGKYLAPLELTITGNLQEDIVATDDASLKTLEVEGKTISGFSATTYSYNMELPYGTVTVPTVTATANSEKATVVYSKAESLPGTTEVQVTSEDETVTNTYKVNFTLATASSEKKLSKVVFANGFDAFIVGNTITTYYEEGTPQPAVKSATISENATYAVVDDKLTVTAQDGSINEFTIKAYTVSPYLGLGKTFDGTENWIKTGNAFNSTKGGWVFSKDVEEETNKRVSEGKCRLSFFVGPCESVTFTCASGITSDRNVNAYVNGTKLLSSQKLGKRTGTITVTCNSSTTNLIIVESSNTSGDAGIGKIEVTGGQGQSFSLTTADTEPYTLYLDYPVTIPTDIEAYTGTLDAKEETLTMKTVEGTIPANTAVIVKSAAAGTYVFKETSTAASIESNSLKGVKADTDIADLVTTGKTLLTLGTKGGKVAFRKPATGTTQVKANKAYLLVDTPSGEGAKTVKMIFDGETTGISEFTANEDATNAPLFNLNGQRVNANAKGLLIKNGKKIIIK